ITSGKNMFPEEIERALETHPAVAAAAVLGVPDAKRGERPVALIKLRPRARARASEFIAHLRRLGPMEKIPRTYATPPHWPRTLSGKSDFAALARVWQAGRCEPLK